MTDAPAPPTAPNRGRFDAAAIRPLLADWVCVAIFVILGKENHGYEKGVTWFLTVWWPLAVGVRTWSSTSYTVDFRPAAQPRRTGWPSTAST